MVIFLVRSKKIIFACLMGVLSSAYANDQDKSECLISLEKAAQVKKGGFEISAYKFFQRHQFTKNSLSPREADIELLENKKISKICLKHNDFKFQKMGLKGMEEGSNKDLISVAVNKLDKEFFVTYVYKNIYNQYPDGDGYSVTAALVVFDFAGKVVRKIDNVSSWFMYETEVYLRDASVDDKNVVVRKFAYVPKEKEESNRDWPSAYERTKPIIEQVYQRRSDGYHLVCQEGYDKSCTLIKENGLGITALNFENYLTPVYDGYLELPKKFSKNKDGYWRDEAGKRIPAPMLNFAGKYFVTAHSCGTSCRYFSMIDLSNGSESNALAMFVTADPPPLTRAGYPYIVELETRPDSAMLIARYYIDAPNGVQCRRKVFLLKKEKLIALSKTEKSCSS